MAKGRQFSNLQQLCHLIRITPLQLLLGLFEQPNTALYRVLNDRANRFSHSQILDFAHGFATQLFGLKIPVGT